MRKVPIPVDCEYCNNPASVVPVARRFLALSRVVACTDGAIILESAELDGYYTDLEVAKPYHARGMLREKGDKRCILHLRRLTSNAWNNRPPR